MVTTDYRDICARFWDKLAAETFASFVASTGVECDVVEVPMRPERYAVLVRRNQIAELRTALDLKPVSNGLAVTEAHLIAGRLARENIPCYVGGSHNPDLLGDADVPIRETKELGCMIAVPAHFFPTAMRLLNERPLSDAELTELALSSPEDKHREVSLARARHPSHACAISSPDVRSRQRKGTSGSPAVVRAIEPVAARRTVLLWLHILCGFAAAIALLSQEDVSLRTLFAGARLRGAHGALLALPAIWPYLVSFMTSRSVVPRQRAYVVVYAAVLIFAAVAGIWVFATAADDLFDGVFVVTAAQAIVFVVVSDRIDDYDWDHRDV